ncbi:MAG: hypothetical protein GY782_00390 [Gammaproteobacteria bacterium]|nr:hypothetical protein [Gammaproteobacteria bacterium]
MASTRTRIQPVSLLPRMPRATRHRRIITERDPISGDLNARGFCQVIGYVDIPLRCLTQWRLTATQVVQWIREYLPMSQEPTKIQQQSPYCIGLFQGKQCHDDLP